jgi:hypothetical protein
MIPRLADLLRELRTVERMRWRRDGERSGQAEYRGGEERLALRPHSKHCHSAFPHHDEKS